MKHQSVANNSGKTQTCIFFFKFSVAIDSGEFLASIFEVLKLYHIQIYPTSLLLCYGKAVNLQQV